MRVPRCVAQIACLLLSLQLMSAAQRALLSTQSGSSACSSTGDSGSEITTYARLTKSLSDIPFPRGWRGKLPSPLETDHQSLEDDRDDEEDEHPIYDPTKEKCGYCGEKGHSILFCPDRLEASAKCRVRFCARGYHLPHLHDNLDVWRCQWCSMHLKTNYVWKWYPTVAAEEYDKQAKRLAGIYKKHR